MKTSSQKRNAVSGLLVKTSHQKVLSFFLANMARRLYGSEISKKVGISTGQTSKILGDLLRAGVVEKERKGKTELYAIVELSSELRLYKTLNTVLNIAPLVNRLKPSSTLIVLYGSCAQGTNTEESDLDLLVVSGARDHVLDTIARFSPRQPYGYANIAPIIKSLSEWGEMGMDMGDPVFFAEVQKGITLFEKGINESRL